MSALQKLGAVPPCDIEYIRLRCRMDGNCWIWSQALREKRYPIMCFRVSGDDGVMRPKNFYVRHIVYWLSKGKLPAFGKNRNILDTCHNPLCVNPAHIKLGTRTEQNKRTAAANPTTLLDRMRTALSRRKNCKLSDEAVIDIRTSGNPSDVAADKHGVSRAYVNMLRRGDWRKDYTPSPFAGLGA